MELMREEAVEKMAVRGRPGRATFGEVLGGLWMHR